MSEHLTTWVQRFFDTGVVDRHARGRVGPSAGLGVGVLLVVAAAGSLPLSSHAQAAAALALPSSVVATGTVEVDRLRSEVEAQRKALQDLQARTRAQAEARRAALELLDKQVRALQADLDSRRRADERESAQERAQVGAVNEALVAAQARVDQAQQRLAAAAAERARLAEQAARERQAQEARLAAQAAQPVIPPGTEKRVALVMGNARYADRPLRNPGNDSALMAGTLKALGFEVQVANDADRRGMLTALREFETRARGADVALFYFAGHGAQVGGANYLIPVGAGIRVENDVPDEAIDASSVLRRIEDSGVKVGLVVLDACRDNPYPGASRSTSRGLARMSAPTGSIVAYATAPGSTAEDGTGDNGTYTAALARHLATPGLDIKEVFDRTAQEVERVTNGKQRPREEVGLRGRFALLEVPGSSGGAVALASAAGAASAMPSAGATGVTPDPDAERTAWDLVVRRDSAAGYEAYLRAYPQGRFATAARVALETFRAPLASAATSAAGATGVVQAVAAGTSSSVQPAQVFKDCAECPEMVVIPAGRFLMGSPESELGRDRDEGPQRWVDVPRFAMGKFEVTQGQWQALMGSNPSHFKDCGLNCPVENVSWNDVQEFLRRLNQRTGQNYRLPSEAEWEYAARAGTTTAYFWGDRFDASRVNNRGNRTVQVGSYSANAFGLHDMHGNVWEWVQDVWHNSYAGAPSDGTARMTGGDPSRRVFRGGSWFVTPQDLRSAYRSRSSPGNRNFYSGFRVARNF
jgi:formylglycine-generating enzyme required for sulfatase activity